MSHPARIDLRTVVWCLVSGGEDPEALQTENRVGALAGTREPVQRRSVQHFVMPVQRSLDVKFLD